MYYKRVIALILVAILLITGLTACNVNVNSFFPGGKDNNAEKKIQ